MVRCWILLVGLGVASVARAELAGSDEARLGAAAGEVRALVGEAQKAGLPPELLVDKTREGLAKGVPPSRIVTVLRGLEQALVRARAEAQPFAGASPPPGLLKAIVEAHAAGAAADDVAVVLRGGGRDRAVQVLTDLVQRGYPAGAAARTVAALSGRPAALEELVGRAERMRGSDEGASRAEILDALARANAQGLGLDHAEQLLHRGAAGGDDGNNGRGPDRETSGPRGPRSAVGHGKGHP